MHTIIGKDLNEAKQLLQRNEVIGIPTETVYGLAGNALLEETLLKIFTVKNRPHFDPLILHVGRREEIEKYTTDVPSAAYDLLDCFSPGPLTLLLNKKMIVPDLVTSGLNTVAIRIPNHPLTLELLQSLTFPLAAPSANPFGYISPTSAQHVFDQLQGKIPYILDGGQTSVGVESTIVGFVENKAVIYRLGGLAVEEIERVTGKVTIEINQSSDPLAPGMLKSHYAPKTPLSIHQSSKVSFGENDIAVICFDQYMDDFPKENQVLLSPSADLNEAARNLFATMRKLDNGNYKQIVAIRFPETGLGRAINDRLQRAAAESG